MPYPYTQELIQSAFTYSNYRKYINEALAVPVQDEHAAKMQHYITNNVALMDEYDKNYHVSADLKTVLANAPATIWLVISEGWCGDAAFNLPMMAAIEKAMPEKVQLRMLFRDSNLDVIDANLTDGGRSIPKLIILSEDLKELGHWGPRPAPLQVLMKEWKSEGLALKELIPKVHEWYDADQTRTVQEELNTLIKTYS